jgi:predicted nucleotidyltransferase
MGATRSTDTDLSSALFGKTRRAVLALLFSNPDEEFYLRQIVRRIRSGQGGVQRELQRLADARVILRSVRGRTTFYQANRACPVFNELRGLVIKTAGVAEVLRAALLPLKEQIEVAFIYGSVARARMRVSSDIDLFVVGTVGFREVVDQLSSAQTEIAREVNPRVRSWRVRAPHEARRAVREVRGRRAQSLRDRGAA